MDNMEFVKVASTKDVAPGEMKAVKAGIKPVLLANLAGKFYAIGNVCTHMGCALSSGNLKGEAVECVCHGSVFDLKTGNVLNGPANKPEPSYQVKIEGDQILVNV